MSGLKMMAHQCANAVKSLIQGRAYFRVCSILFKFVKSVQNFDVPNFLQIIATRDVRVLWLFLA